MPIEPKDLSDLGSLADKVSQEQIDKRSSANGRLTSSFMADPNPSRSLTAYSVGDILSGVTVIKPSGVTIDIFNHELSKELEGIKSEELYHGDPILDPYDVFSGNPAKPFDASALGGLGAATSSALTSEQGGSGLNNAASGPVEPYSGDVYEHPRDYGHTNAKLDPTKLSGFGFPDGSGRYGPEFVLWRNAAHFARKMVEDGRAQGADFGVNSAYRNYAHQAHLKATKGKMAAAPGRSNHGWGLAIDFSAGKDGKMRAGTPGFEFLRNNAARYHFHCLLEYTKDPYEPWHWQYDPWAERGDNGARAFRYEVKSI